jgi:hypothetical protein
MEKVNALTGCSAAKADITAKENLRGLKQEQDRPIFASFSCSPSLPLPFFVPNTSFASIVAPSEYCHMIIKLCHMSRVAGPQVSCDQSLEEKGQCQIFTLL